MTTQKKHIMDLFSDENSPHRRYLPIINQIQESNPKIRIWDIPYSIQKLSYYVHSHYRYYGKFPSVLAGQLLDEFPPPTPEHYVLDNFCGSGTTLVEAKLRGTKSYGVDISWLSVLASNVKVQDLDIKEVTNSLNKLVLWFERNREKYSAPTDSFVEKWFTPESARDLKVIHSYLLNLEVSNIRKFLLLAFLGIIRRVSRAYDGEVRPHINKAKRTRDVISAFSKKVNDMCKDHFEFSAVANSDVASECYLASNIELPKKFDDKKCYFVISHPPYLNSFNYAPVYSLEFYWGKDFESEYASGEKELYKSELKAHPANEGIVNAYFHHLTLCYEETYRIQPKGGYLAIVIGDCTRKGVLIDVIGETIRLVENIGYSLEEINYRTTHYGLGKYAYKHRADYHDDAEKKDAVIVFKK